MKKPSFLTWRPTTTIILIVGIVALLIYSLGAYIATHFRPTVETQLGSGVYHLWLADDEIEREKGLSGVTSLASNGGLLMKFDSDGTWGIWMKDMEVSLDIVWLDANKEVIYIVKNASPELSTDTTFTPKIDARYVIELPAGTVENAGIKTGTKAEFNELNEEGIW